MPATFSGSYTVAVTPFTDDLSRVDLDRLRAFLDWQLAEGVPGIIMLGTTGEFLSVTPEERRELVGATVEHIAGRIPVLVGTADASTTRAVQFSVEARDLGADGLMIVPPYYYTPTDDEIYRHYEAIVGAVDLPIMLYNNPVTSNVDMSAELVARLAKDFATVSYIKESSQDIARVRDVIDLAGDAITVYAGERVVDSYLLGAQGYVNPYGNYIPRASAGIWGLLEEGRIEDARRIDGLIKRFDAIIAAGHPTYGHQCYSKRLAERAGYPMGTVRPPLTTFAQLGAEGEDRLNRIGAVIDELDDLTRQLGL
ncbi:dihydrodipicolinate synthase family protein [Microbacterium sp. ET2]|uniref:dihydrodipicolinate synthase family protein n=1 Tax=Microbacterium albipurpureum TaxID=3050384 RepID=UPI00259CB80C|nr:dihydrodipicolinate synthase family protein [Microbacterium sp. ET2 (Ac-2212)]WJL96369.1 dihydrodipicolinate synthase family protein [Microbacterium sp. ET2 (Ac-2212)]